MSLGAFLSREQRAFLSRDREGWSSHLARVRTFLGDGLRSADTAGSVLIIGAGAGLEVPWHLAPRQTTGWDGDPWSRVRTLARHHRWVPWVFEDVTGGFEALAQAGRRCVTRSWSRQRREHAQAVARLAGLLPSLHPDAAPLRTWIAEHRPGTILAANLMGQFGSIAHRVVEQVFTPLKPWEEDPEIPDALADALEAWTARAVQSFLRALSGSGAELWLVHDRGVVFGDDEARLGELVDPWTVQLTCSREAEASDALAGVDVRAELGMFHVERMERWLWPVASGQLHVVEALAVRR